MELTSLNSALIDSMSVDDLRTTLKEAYSQAMLNKINEEEAKKKQELQEQVDKAFLDTFFSNRFNRG